MAEAGALSADASAMLLHEAAGHGEAEAEPAPCAVQGGSDLGEGLEDGLEHVGSHADSLVFDAQHGLSALLAEGDEDGRLRRGGLHGGVEKVADDLLDTDRISTHHQLV